MRWAAIALVLGALGCVTTTSVTRTGSGLFAPRESADEEEAPRGLTLSSGIIASDGSLSLDLRNYSEEPFVFLGAPDRPQLIIEAQSGSTRSRHTISPWSKQTYEVPAGERLQLKAKIGGISGRVRVGIRSHDLGYVVWTEWIAR